MNLNMAKRLAIIAFSLWHMAAVGIYSLPNETEDRVTVWMKVHLIPIVRPYLFATSQWQQWNLFSPDPIRRVSFYSVTIDAEGSPEETVFLDHEHLPWWRDGDELKILRRMEDADEQWEGVRMLYLEMFCRERGLPPGTALTLAVRGYVIPRPAVPMGASYWLSIGPALQKAYEQQRMWNTDPVQNISSFSYDIASNSCP